MAGISVVFSRAASFGWSVGLSRSSSDLLRAKSSIDKARLSCAPVSDNPATVRPSIICFLLLALNQACWAQELSAEDRACITKAAGKLPKVAAIGQSRVVPQPQRECGRTNFNLYL